MLIFGTRLALRTAEVKKSRGVGDVIERVGCPQKSMEAMEEKPGKAEKKARKIETPCI
jgi:hypothetical protein